MYIQSTNTQIVCELCKLKNVNRKINKQNIKGNIPEKKKK